jgi:hypothetical protein
MHSILKEPTQRLRRPLQDDKSLKINSINFQMHSQTANTAW